MDGKRLDADDITSQEAVDTLRSTGALVRLTMARHRDVDTVINLKQRYKRIFACKSKTFALILDYGIAF